MAEARLTVVGGTKGARRNLALLILLYLLALWLAATALHGEDATAIHITRAAGPITIDGDLSDPGWKGATRSTPGSRRTRATTSREGQERRYLTYDDRFLYAAFEFDDPTRRRSARRSPTATTFGSTPTTAASSSTRATTAGRGSCSSPIRAASSTTPSATTSGGEDSSPDLYWDSAAKITKDGWILEMRIPFSSLRYPKGDPQTWGILLYRNYPRDFRYQIFTTKLPRGSSCFICHCAPLTGLERLPSGGHLVVAPYGTLKEEAVPRGDADRHSVNKPVRGDGGVDAKWMPNENTAIDATINPDFSQVESDVAQIGVNQRFALFYPGEAPVLPRGDRALLDADPGRLHAHHHLAAVGRARDRQDRRHRLHRARRGGPRRRKRHPAGPELARASPTRTSTRSSRSDASGTTSGSPSSASS